MSTALCWIRRDLRLTDNRALCAAIAACDQVLPVYVLDPVLLKRYAGTKRLAFLLDGLRQLDADLGPRGSRLVVRQGDAAQELAKLAAEAGAGPVFAEEDYTPYARRRDERVARCLSLHLVGGLVLRPPRSVLKADGNPYTVFTPFRRRWKEQPPPLRGEVWAAPSRIATPPDLPSLPVPAQPTLPAEVPFPAGESEAQRRLQAFVEGTEASIYRYAEERNRVDLEGTSRLSPYLRFGMLSARQVVVAAYKALQAAPDAAARQGVETWLNELIWREFYVAILHFYPYVLERSFRPVLQDIAWENDQGLFAAWREGRTGYPIVDAAMRQLAASGWMHNRARMIVASFLVKDLLIDWRWGERLFMQHLVDGDPAANNGGWQWVAGTGTDAAPYFRVFNPLLQGGRYDPQGDYVRRWVPELARVPRRHIHAPWRMSSEAQRAYGCVIGEDYSAPIVDHAWARERALAAYRAAQEGSVSTAQPGVG